MTEKILARIAAGGKKIYCCPWWIATPKKPISRPRPTNRRSNQARPRRAAWDRWPCKRTIPQYPRRPHGSHHRWLGQPCCSCRRLNKPLRQRTAEALRYFLGVRVSVIRERLRQLTRDLSARAGTPPAELFNWFAWLLGSSTMPGKLIRAGVTLITGPKNAPYGCTGTCAPPIWLPVPGVRRPTGK